MSKIIKQVNVVEHFEYRLEFSDPNEPGFGYAFPCTEDGEVDVEELSEKSQFHYDRCINGYYNFIRNGVVRHEWTHREPAELECDCGETVILDSFTNTCDACSRDYNAFGQLLGPRENWGEETGEHWTDCY